MVGTPLVARLLKEGHTVTRLVRDESSPKADEAFWNPESGRIDAARLEEHDAAIHLAGEPVSAMRWTEEKKRRIRESRVKGTRLLAETLARLASPPRTLLCASAIGYYGDRDDEILTEKSAPGADFLAGVCREWEQAGEAARERGIRTVHLRIGVVLGQGGGALAKTLTPFKLGLGGRFGDGEQYMSWIAIDDVVGAILFALNDAQLEGAVNTVAPRAVKNSEFTSALGRVLNRPTIFPVPAAALRLALGEMADALLLSSVRVRPERLIEANYQFKFPELEPALRHLLKRD